MTTAIRTSRPDNNYLSICDEEDSRRTTDLLPDKPEQYDSILKITGFSKWTWIGSKPSPVHIAQGKEACVDINNLSRHTFIWGIFGELGEVGQSVVKIKGGSWDTSLEGVMRSRGRFWDISIGEWSDQSTVPCEDYDFSDLVHADGKPIRVIVGRGEWPRPFQLGPNCKVLFWWSMAAKAYWWGKWALVKSGAWALGVKAQAKIGEWKDQVKTWVMSKFSRKAEVVQ